jgi:hypothetical protein
MKKARIILAAILGIFCYLQAYALDTALLDIRKKIFEESKTLKVLLSSTRDVILVNSIWDSSVMAISQIDAYFSMLGIINTIKKDDLSEESLAYLSDWLLQIKMVNDLNIKSLSSLKSVLDNSTKARIANFLGHLAELNAQINIELNKIATLKKVSKPKKRR